MNAFTPTAGQVLALSRDEADRFHHGYVGTEHLLLGLVRLGQGVAFNILQRLGLDLATTRGEVERLVATNPGTALSSRVPYTLRFKKVLALSGMEAKALNHTWVGSGHLLLGLLHENHSAAARILESRGAEIETTRIEVDKAFKNNPEKKSAPARPAYRKPSLPGLVRPVHKNQRLPILVMSCLVCLLISVEAYFALVRH